MKFNFPPLRLLLDNGEHEDGRNGVAVEIMWMMNFPFRRNGIFVTYETEEYVEVSQTDL